MDDDKWTIKEVATYLKIKENAVYALVVQGKIPNFKVGGSWLFRKSEIDRWNKSKGYNMSIGDYNGKIPLLDYPWHNEIDRLAKWALGKDNHTRAFCFDFAMSLAYIDATSGIEKYIETCTNAPSTFNSHLGFISLCALCYESKGLWTFQEAAKPQSGTIGKLSSEMILRFIRNLYPQFESILAIGGTETADAIIQHENGTVILAEVKSAPLLTYPVLFSLDKEILHHEQVNVTSSQLRELHSALYLHGENYIPLGQVKSELWPFKPAVDFVVNAENDGKMNEIISSWLEAKRAYEKKDRESKMYYLANASGFPPQEARTRDGWPKKESISDSKTSAGMDRTDDIKKAIYQVLKIGAKHSTDLNVRTAIISNLPAYRHGKEYVNPFLDMLWGSEANLTNISGKIALEREKLKLVFDYIITLDAPVLRELSDV